jgi:hypothetical protein
MTMPNHALQRPAIASRLQSNALVGRVAGSLGDNKRSKRKITL